MIYQYDITPPTLSITSPTGTSSGNPAKTQGGYITVNGTAKDEANGSGVKRVLITVNNETPIEVIPNGNGSFSYNVVLTDYNVKTVGIQAEDNAGNLSGKIVVYLLKVVPSGFTKDITMSINACTWCAHSISGPSYSGDRQNAPTSVSGSWWAGGCYYDNGGKGGPLGSSISGSITVTGIIPTNAALVSCNCGITVYDDSGKAIDSLNNNNIVKYRGHFFRTGNSFYEYRNGYHSGSGSLSLSFS